VHRIAWRSAACVAAWVISIGACADSGTLDAPVKDPESGVFAADLAEAQQVRAHLTSMRALGGREAAVPFAAAETHLRAARKRLLAGDDARMVLDDQLQLAADNSERDIAFWYRRVEDLDKIDFPPKLLRSRRLSVGIMVVHPQQAGALGSFFVLFAMADPDQSD
jgi:hypothetical protein